MYMYSITCPLLLITSHVAILYLPINLFCPLYTALILTSDNFHLFFPPSLPPLPFQSHNCLVAVFKTPTWRHLYHVFTYIYSLLIEKDIYECRNISNKFPCICEISFFGKSFPFLFPFFVLVKH